MRVVGATGHRHDELAVDDRRDRDATARPTSFAKLLGASLLVGLMATVLCAAAWLIARWLKL
jgi:hypothetical protein